MPGTKSCEPWNLRVEQLPFYPRDVFGREAVVETARLLAGEFPADSREGGAMHGIGVTMRAQVVPAGAAVFAVVVGIPLSRTPPPPPNRLRQDSPVSHVDSGGEFRMT